MERGRSSRRGIRSRVRLRAPGRARARAQARTDEHEVTTPPAPIAGQIPAHLVLRDGADVPIRPILASDREALRTMYEQLSDESRYRRFLNVRPKLGERELTYLTEIDHHDHEALVAFDGERGPIIGVVRYVKLSDDEAEPAMLIADGWQGQGLCGAMLEQLVVRAWAEGVRHFRAPVLAGNLAALRSLDRLGRSVHHQVGSEVEVEIELRAPLVVEPTPQRPRRVLRPRSTRRAVVDELIPRRRATRPEDVRDAIVAGVPTDGDAEATVRVAGELAQQLGCELWIVSARRGERLEDVRGEIDRLSAPLRAAGVDVHKSVRRTTPASAMVAVAAEQRARLVVLGGSPRGAGSIMLTGAISDTVVRQAPCDVLIVRG